MPLPTVALLRDSPYPTRKANTIQSWHMARAFAARGWDPVVVAPDAPIPAAYQCLPEDASEFSSGTRISRSPNVAGPLAAPRLAWGLLRTIEKIRPDLVFSRSLYGALATAARGFPTVFESHMEFTRAHERAALRLLAALPAGRGFVAISESMAARLVRLGIRRSRVLVAHDAADPRLLGITPSRASGARFTVGYLGHLHPGRGTSIVMDVAALLPEVEFLFVGGGDDAVARARAEVRDRGLANVRFEGHVPYTRIPDWLARFDVALLPYTSDLDTRNTMSPLKLFEYMAAGLAIVSTDHAPLREILEDEEAALFVPPDDANAMADAIARLVRDEKLRQTFGQHSRAQARHHTWDARVESILRFVGAQ